MRLFRDSMLKARELTLGGKLMEATLAIQQGLGISRNKTDKSSSTAAAADERVVDTPQVSASPGKQPFHTSAVEADVEDVVFREFGFREETAAPVDPVDSPAPTATASTFSLETFQFGKHKYAYRVFVPGDPRPDMPVVVMLHGCKQDARDFAAGTTMNAVAEREKFIVVYPEQLRQANSMGCWNWFEPAHQARGEGEPAMIAALASHVASLHRADSARIYIAGLSAGGAMAALAGKLYPDVFAAVGVHSGLAPARPGTFPPHSPRCAQGRASPQLWTRSDFRRLCFRGPGTKRFHPSTPTSLPKRKSPHGPKREFLFPQCAMRSHPMMDANQAWSGGQTRPARPMWKSGPSNPPLTPGREVTLPVLSQTPKDRAPARRCSVFLRSTRTPCCLRNSPQLEAALRLLTCRGFISLGQGIAFGLRACRHGTSLRRIWNMNARFWPIGDIVVRTSRDPLRPFV